MEGGCAATLTAPCSQLGAWEGALSPANSMSMQEGYNDLQRQHGHPNKVLGRERHVNLGGCALRHGNDPSALWVQSNRIQGGARKACRLLSTACTEVHSVCLSRPSLSWCLARGP